MAQEIKIPKLVGEDVFTNLEKFNKELGASKEKYVEYAAELSKGIHIKVDSISSYNAKVDTLSASIKKLAETQNQISSLQKKQFDYYKQVTEEIKKKSDAVVNEAKANDLNAKAELNVAKAETERLRQQKILNKESKKRKVTAEETASVLNIEAKSIKEAREQNNYLRRAVAEVEGTDKKSIETRGLLNKKIDENTKFLKQNTDAYTRQKMTIGDYKQQILEAFKSQQTLSGGIKQSISLIKEQKGAIMLVLGSFVAYKAAAFAFQQFTKFVSDAINKIKDFEKANSILASILGTTSKDIKELTQDAKRLGAATAATASQVTQLQTELAKLGFSREEILASTEAVLQFALATGAELPDAASLAGAALRIFDADAQDMNRYVSAMAVATNKSALSFSKLATAIPIVGPVAKAFGFEIEDVLTLLGKLSDAGMDASMSATATRNILLNLADANGKLAKSLGRPVHNIEELSAAFIELKNKGIDLAQSLELTDKRSVAAFARLIDGASIMNEFKKSITDVSDELKETAEERVNNLSGSLTKLSSAWEGLMLSFSNSSGTMKNVIDFFTKLVGHINVALQNDEEYSQTVIENTKNRAIETAKDLNSIETYYNQITISKLKYIKDGYSEVEAQEAAQRNIVHNLKESLEEQIALQQEYGKKSWQLKFDLKNRSFIELMFPPKKNSEYKIEIDIADNKYKDAAYKVANLQYLYDTLTKSIEAANKEEDKTGSGFTIPLTPEEIEKQKRAAEKAANEQLKIQHTLEQSRIDLMNDGFEKEYIQMALNFQKKIDAVKGQSKEEEETRKNLRLQMSKALQEFDEKHKIEIEKTDINNQLVSVEKDTKKYLDLRLRMLDLQYKVDVKQAEKNGNDINAITAKYDKLKADEKAKYADEEIKRIQEHYAYNAIVVNTAMQDELESLSEQFAKGLITRENYEKEKTNIQQKYAIQQYEDSIALIQDQLDNEDISIEKRKSLEQKLAEAKAKLYEEEKNIAIQTNDEIIKSERKKQQDIQQGLQLLSDAVGALSDLTSNIFESKIKDLDEQLEKLEETSDAEIAHIEKMEKTGAITKEEAEARKRAAEETTAIKKKELEKQQAELQQRQAKYDKAASIAQTIINTSQAIMKTYSETGFFGGTVGAAIIAAIGAAQLATIIAQPIPKYAEGTKDKPHKGGLAVVGDGGKSEAIMIGNKIYSTPSIPTLTMLPAGAEVFPDIHRLTADDIRKMPISDLRSSMLLSEMKSGKPFIINNNIDVSGLRQDMQTNNKLTHQFMAQQRRLANDAFLRDYIRRNM